MNSIVSILAKTANVLINCYILTSLSSPETAIAIVEARSLRSSPDPERPWSQFASTGWSLRRSLAGRC